jgi:hypothetical protein
VFLLKNKRRLQIEQIGYKPKRGSPKGEALIFAQITIRGD